MEQVAGIEPASSAWKAEVLPLNYTCTFLLTSINYKCSFIFCQYFFKIFLKFYLSFTLHFLLLIFNYSRAIYCSTSSYFPFSNFNLSPSEILFKTSSDILISSIASLLLLVISTSHILSSSFSSTL